MAFSAVLGVAQLGMSALGMFQAGGAQRRAEQMRAQEMEQMRKQQGFQNFMGMQAQERWDAENERLGEIEQLNRLLAGQERQFQIEQMGVNRGLIDQQRQYQIDRQVEMDREAARVQAMQLEQLLRNQQISEDERRFAEQQLQEQKAIAAGEREQDLRQYYETQAVREAEREFVMQQFYGAQQEGRARQSREQQMYDRLLEQVTGMQRAVGMAASDLGEMPDAPRMTKQDLDSEISRRQEAYQSDVDRAATRVASQNEANLVRAGLDASTPGVSARGDITRRIADEYQSARDRAYDDALKYITGQQDMLMSGYNADVQRRGNVLSEVAGVHGAGLEELMRAPDVHSLEALLSSAGQMIPSAAYDRSIQSAAVNPQISETARFTGSIDPGISQYNVDAWSYGNDWQGIGSAIRPAENRNMINPQSYFNAAANMAGSRLNTAQSDLDYARDRSASAAHGFGQDLRSFANDYGGQIDDYFGWGQGAEVGDMSSSPVYTAPGYSASAPGGTGSLGPLPGASTGGYTFGASTPAFRWPSNWFGGSGTQLSYGR